MSFGTFARKVRDSSLPYGRRVSALGSCVQLYRPIGFQATLSFLEVQAGPFSRDEAALLRAIDVLEGSRALWQAELRVYADLRRRAKLEGQRAPRPDDMNPNTPAHWYGARQEAALHALRFWRRRRLAALISANDSVAQDLNRCVSACLDSGGQLTSAQLQLLCDCVDRLEQRLRPEVWHDDQMQYFRYRDLLRVGRLLETATTPG
jgi:hypothetical protein